MVELREGLLRALHKRSKRMKSVMLEITLLDHINDSPEDAAHLADFCQPIINVGRAKLVVNLIPWNDIGATTGPASMYRKAPLDRILAFQKVLTDANILCFVRTTRGDDELAACGQLTTKKQNRS
jgi:23S rRNA (adenine2503-C2)-methyltransferase